MNRSGWLSIDRFQSRGFRKDIIDSSDYEEKLFTASEREREREREREKRKKEEKK